MKILNTLAEKIIEKSFYFSVWFIEQFSETEKLKEKTQRLSKLEEGTLGKEIANILNQKKINLVPNYESHDLKHALLGFKMTPLDEIRMQAFMLGNGNWSFPSLAIFIFGVVLLPSKWKLFRTDFIEGATAIPIKDWSIELFADKQLDELREYVFNSTSHKLNQIKDSKIRKTSQYGSIVIVAAGIFGMLYCFPYLWSSNMADLVGAGFPFLAGSILVVGGMINLSILSRDIPLENQITNES